MNDDTKLSLNAVQKNNVVCKLLSKFLKNGLCMVSYQYVLSNKNSLCNAYHFVKVPWKNTFLID